MNDAKAPPRMTTLMYYAYMSWQARGADKVSRYLAYF